MLIVLLMMLFCLFIEKSNDYTQVYSTIEQ